IVIPRSSSTGTTRRATPTGATDTPIVGPPTGAACRSLPTFCAPRAPDRFPISPRRGHISGKHLGTDRRCERRTDGRYGGGRGAEPGTVRATMSFQRIKTWMLTAACAGLIGITAGDAHAFCGKLFGKKGGAAD